MVAKRRRKSIVAGTLSFFSAALSGHRQRGPRARRLRLEWLEPRQLLAGDPLASVTTDQPDYAPGETARIVGSGFAIGQAVELQVLHSPAVAPGGAGHAPWYIVDGGVGDLDGQADGRFATTWYVDPDDSLGAEFRLTARGVGAGPDGLLGTPDDVDTGPIATATFPCVVTADLSVTVDDGKTESVPGTMNTYTITVTNNGPETVPMPYMAIVKGTRRGQPNVPLETWAEKIDKALRVGESWTYQIDSWSIPAATSQLDFTVTVAGVAGLKDSNPANDAATDADTLTPPQIDLRIAMTSTSPVPGEIVTYTIDVTNYGPSNASGASVADNLPDILMKDKEWQWEATWAGEASASAVSGYGDIANQTVNVRGCVADLEGFKCGTAKVTYTVWGPIDSAAIGTISNTATVTAPSGATETNTADNAATVAATLTPQADLTIAVSHTADDKPHYYAPGGSTDYKIVVTNNGPSDNTGVTVKDTFPANLTSHTWTASGTLGTVYVASGLGDLSQTVSIPAHGSITYIVTADIRPTATGNLVNEAEVFTTSVPNRHSPSKDTDTDTQHLTITVTNEANNYIPGRNTKYTIVIENPTTSGSDITGAVVTDTFPADLTDVTWDAEVGGSIVASGLGNLAETVSIPVGGKITYTVTANIRPTASTDLVNTARVTAFGDSHPEFNVNNAATDTDTWYPPVVQTFYLPFPAADVLTALKSIQTNSTAPPPPPISPISTFTSIAITQNRTYIYYDHWENGFVNDIAEPTEKETYDINNPDKLAGVQIWGDGDLTNGVAPGHPTDTLDAGDVITLPPLTGTPPTYPTIPVLPTRDKSEIFFDGGDKLAASNSIAISVTSWATGPATLLGDALEVYDTSRWGNEYEVPIGEDTSEKVNALDIYGNLIPVRPVLDIAGNLILDEDGYPIPFLPNFFTYSGLTIMAARDGTKVRIDLDGEGPVDLPMTITLVHQGDAYLVDGGIKQGATVVSVDDSGRPDPNKPIQVDLITGRRDATYESRWFTLAPRGPMDDPKTSWSNSYYTPVSTSWGQDGSEQPTGVYLYNPNLSDPLTVTYVSRDRGGTGSLVTAFITIPPRGTAMQQIPAGSGAHFFTSEGQNFYAVSVTGVAPDVDDTKISPGYDWGMSLIPVRNLTTQAKVAMGFGRDATLKGKPTDKPNENGSPVWVTPVGNPDRPVWVYVDYKGDSLEGFRDPNGYQYDVKYNLLELQSQEVFDPSGDQSGMLLYTLDANVKLAVAWGEDPIAASVGAPGMDVGTYVPPLPEFNAGKNAILVEDANHDGVVSPGDTLEYTIVVTDISRFEKIDDIWLSDELPDGTIYVANSTKYSIADGQHGPGPRDETTHPLEDDSIGTRFPLDGDGKLLPPLYGWDSYTVTFRAEIVSDLAAGVTRLINQGTAYSPQLGTTVALRAETPLYRLGDYVWVDANANGLQDAGELGLSGVTVKLLDANGTTPPQTTTTDASGHYGFTAAPGKYQFQFMAPDGYVFTTQYATGDQTAANDSNANAFGFSGQVTLLPNASGASDQTIDAGLLTPQNNVGVTKTDSVGGSSITPSTGAVVPGSSFTYTITVSNAGPSTATNVTVNDPVPVGLASFLWSGNGKTDQPGPLNDI
ncbi:MAG: hypothetical protein NTY19_04235, partial [Planctomycetota bacterium]|nr:hypothetical protein [Planctomycetota bacterium]